MRAASATHSGESAAIAARRVLTSFVRATAICTRAAKAAQTATVASQAAPATSASGIATGESGTVITHKYRGSQQFSRVEYSTQIAVFCLLQ